MLPCHAAHLSACGGAKREKYAEDTPATPVKGWLPLTIPLVKGLKRY